MRRRRTKKKQKHVANHRHFTRSKQKAKEFVLHVSSARSPKPKLPTGSEARKSKRWHQAFRREIVKINEEGVMVALDKDRVGRYIRPENAVVMRLIAILEWKWKPDS